MGQRQNIQQPLQDLQTSTAPQKAASTPNDALPSPELIEEFIGEAKGNLAAIELSILALETNPQDLEAINNIFRRFHNIKGVASFLGLETIQRLSHAVENLLDDARSRRLKVTNKTVDMVLRATDLLKLLLQDLETTQNTDPQVQSFLACLATFHPDSDEETASKRLGEIMVEQGIVAQELVDWAAEQAQVKGTRIGEELIKEGLAGVGEVSKALRAQREFKEKAGVVRISTQKLDNLVAGVGELVVVQALLLRHPLLERCEDQRLQQHLKQLRRITTKLQNSSIALHMVPLKNTFQKMLRLVRDLCQKCGKEVVLELQGEDTEIDRHMVEEIFEPLVHMLRNAVDHGIGSIAERQAAGKNPQGKIRLSAEQSNGNIILEVRDDGKGLDLAKIRAQGIARGLIKPNAKLADVDLYELIFHPGFSTKGTITTVSGRGVGMDVVKAHIERLQGKIEISSNYGQGCCFKLKIPLTVAAELAENPCGKGHIVQAKPAGPALDPPPTSKAFKA